MEIVIISGFTVAIIAIILSIVALNKISNHKGFHDLTITPSPSWSNGALRLDVNQNKYDIRRLEKQIDKLEENFEVIRAIPVGLMETKNTLGLKESHIVYDDAIDITWITCYLQVDLLAREAGVDISNNLDDAKYAKFKLTKDDHTLLIDINKEITGPRLYQTLAIQLMNFIKETKNDK